MKRVAIVLLFILFVVGMWGDAFAQSGDEGGFIKEVKKKIQWRTKGWQE